MAYYARKDFVNNPELTDKSVEILKGNPTFDWMDLEIERVRCRPSNPDRGLTYDDTNVGSYGWDQIPEKIRHNFSMAPRGSVMPPGLPNLGYDINRKSEVWSANAPELYEEAKARHWIPTREVPWEELKPLGHSEDAERALAQLYTDLTSMSTVLEDIPSKWVWHINHELLELKSLLCAQMFNAAQLADVFRKRAIAGGTGLGRDHAELGELLKGVFDAGTYPCASVSSNLVIVGLMQILLRHIGAVSSNAADVTIGHFAAQDVTRSLAYGIGHVRFLLDERPHEGAALIGRLEEIEKLAVRWLASPLLFSALAVVTGGSREKANASVSRVFALYRAFAEEHVARCEFAGLARESGSSPLVAFVRDLEG